MRLNDIVRYLLIPLPLVLGYLLSSLCPMRSRSGRELAYRPPPIVFAIVWPVLYILLGLSMWRCCRHHPSVPVLGLYVLLLIMLNLWQFFFGCRRDQQASLYCLLLAVTLTVMIMGFVEDRYTWVMLSPLLVWLLFATQMNAHLVQIRSNPKQHRLIRL